MFFEKLTIAIIMTEAFSEILSSGSIFEALRKRLLGDDPKNPRLAGLLLSCGYCLSFWIGIMMSYSLNVSGQFPWLKWAEPLVWGVVSHRMANLLHGAWSTAKHLRDAWCVRMTMKKP